MTTNNALPSEQIQEGNKLIAEFMGYKFDPNKKDELKFYKESREGSWKSKSYSNPLYHRSWSWLMQVVEKIEDLENGNAFFVEISISWCEIGANTQYAMAFDIDMPTIKHREDTKILATWKAIIDFIKWHNEQK